MKMTLNIIAFLYSSILISQNYSITVIDNKGNVLENVNAFNTNHKNYNVSNEFGKMQLENVKNGDTLIINALGFKKDTIAFNYSDSILVLENQPYNLKQVLVLSDNNTLNEIAKIDIKTAPVNSSQEILRRVPGLFIGQHAGGGKAEQLFLRGFDIDHGTDIAIAVDGMPVNMVSHAHGQGYADLHFVIPELINNIEFGKGTYYANKGDFATAGYVDFHTYDRISQNNIQIDYGQLNTLRALGMVNILGNSKNQNAYIASEYIKTDGFFDAKQDFNRFNLFGKYTYWMLDNSKLSLQASYFDSKWNASGQIPQRIVNSGLISRFGSIDSTEGGNTSRTNLNLSFNKILNKKSFIKNNVFFSKYDFNLFSNFTFFLEDTLNGDQIRQSENRNLYGFNSELNSNFGGIDFQLGIAYREDRTNNTALQHTKNRVESLNILKLGSITQNNISSYLNVEVVLGKLKINPALRLDYFSFGYQDNLEIEPIKIIEKKGTLSPKLNLSYSVNPHLQLYSKNGFGFHSNDSRVVVQNPKENILPTAFGNDLGMIYKPLPNLVLNAALWHLFLEQEFVYVGDAGIVEPSGRTRRLGVDIGFKYQISDAILLNSDINYAYARSIDEAIGNNFIPLAPDLTFVNSLTINSYKGFSGSIRNRFLKSRPANQDNSIAANGYFVSDATISYEYKKLSFGVNIENIWNTKWNETQFATVSRLQNEPNSTEEIHFTPGTPRLLKFRVGYRF
jgi:TonB-dependent Receptor Plug Domain